MRLSGDRGNDGPGLRFQPSSTASTSPQADSSTISPPKKTVCATQNDTFPILHNGVLPSPQACASALANLPSTSWLAAAYQHSHEGQPFTLLQSDNNSLTLALDPTPHMNHSPNQSPSLLHDASHKPGAQVAFARGQDKMRLASFLVL
jgi:hypothetical protein